MVFSENLKVGYLLQNDAAKAVLEKHFPGFTTAPQLGMAKGFTLKTLAAFPQAKISPVQLKACAEELAKTEG